MKTREYADWLDGLVIDSKPCPKALKRVATRLRELEATIYEIEGLLLHHEMRDELHVTVADLRAIIKRQSE